MYGLHSYKTSKLFCIFLLVGQKDIFYIQEAIVRVVSYLPASRRVSLPGRGRSKIELIKGQIAYKTNMFHIFFDISICSHCSHLFVYTASSNVACWRKTYLEFIFCSPFTVATGMCKDLRHLKNMRFVIICLFISVLQHYAQCRINA